MNAIRSMSFLRLVLAVDAVSSAAMGLGLVVSAEFLATWTSIPQALLFNAGLALLPFSLVVGFLATRTNPPRAAVWGVVVVNAVWVVESIALLLTDWIAPNLLGSIFIATQAIAVGVFAELQYLGLRKERMLAA